LLSLIPGLPLSAGVLPGIQAALYIGLAGVGSLGLFALIHGIWKLFWKYVLKSEDPVPEIILPGEVDHDEDHEDN
jgi:hypothetical protein